MRVTFLVHTERLEAVRLQQAQTTGKVQQQRKATQPSITSRAGGKDAWVSSIRLCLGDIFHRLLHAVLPAAASVVNVRRGRGSSSLSGLVLAVLVMFELSQQGRFPRKPLAERELAGCLLVSGSGMSWGRKGSNRILPRPSSGSDRGGESSDKPEQMTGLGCSFLGRTGSPWKGSGV